MKSLRRLRQLVVGSVVLALLGATLIIQQWSASSRHILTHPFFNYSLELPDPEQSCQIPRIHPFDQSVWKYFPPPKNIVCKSRQPESLLYFDGKSRLLFDSDLLSEYPRLFCSYKPVLRPDGNDVEVTYGAEVAIPPEGLTVEHDFILVKCVQKNVLALEKVIYEGFLLQATGSNSVKYSSSGDSQNVKLFSQSNSAAKKPKPYNVLLFGIDSLSRLAFIRLLPKTYSYLTNTLKANILRGMNKVADNTFPNLIAMLAGDDAYAGRLPLPPTVAHYDDWPFIWKNYSAIGYQTLFAEDLPDFNMFNYLSTGFKNPPTPCYLRPLWLAVKDSNVLKSSSHLCLGARPRHQVQTDYVEDFVTKHEPYFAFSFLAEVSHDYLSHTASADSDFEAFLRRLQDGGKLKDTVLVVFSDHGHRFDAIRETPVGRIEERMPFFSVVLPRTLQKSALASNTGRLVTPYDVHATLSDLVSNQEDPTKLGNLHTRFGISLFGSIPANRTCTEAGIPDHYCVCSAYQEDDTDEALNVELQKAAGQTVIDSVNDLLTSQCARLELSEVKSAMRSPQGGWVILVRARPSDALFEALVKESSEPKRFITQGEVSRINKYKGQSNCVNNAVLRKYCYCS